MRVIVPPLSRFTLMRRAGIELRLTTDLDVIDGCRRNLDATRNIPPWMIDDVHLQAADTTVPFCPFAHLAQRDWARVDQPNHLGAFCSRVSIGLLRQHGEGFRENAHWTTCIRTRERRARNVAHPQMVMLMGVCLKGRFDSAQARDPAQLSAHHRHKMIPAFERFVVGIAVMPLDDFPKLPSIDRFEKLPKDAIHVLHARPFSVSRQPESIRFTLDLPGMRCGIVNHSRDSPAPFGRGCLSEAKAGEGVMSLVVSRPLIRHGLRIADAKHRRPIRERRPKDAYGHLLPQGERGRKGVPLFYHKGQHCMDIKVRDSNGALLAEGDSVTLIKDLKLKGSSTVLKRGTVIKNIHLTDNVDEIEGRTDKVKGLVLRTEFLKKA